MFVKVNAYVGHVSPPCVGFPPRSSTWGVAQHYITILKPQFLDLKAGEEKMTYLLWNTPRRTNLKGAHRTYLNLEQGLNRRKINSCFIHLSQQNQTETYRVRRYGLHLRY
jgi:hypothetical protein